MFISYLKHFKIEKKSNLTKARVHKCGQIFELQKFIR